VPFRQFGKLIGLRFQPAELKAWIGGYDGREGMNPDQRPFATSSENALAVAE